MGQPATMPTIKMTGAMVIKAKLILVKSTLLLLEAGVVNVDN